MDEELPTRKVESALTSAELTMPSRLTSPDKANAVREIRIPKANTSPVRRTITMCPPYRMPSRRCGGIHCLWRFSFTALFFSERPFFYSSVRENKKEQKS